MNFKAIGFWCKKNLYSITAFLIFLYGMYLRFSTFLKIPLQGDSLYQVGLLNKVSFFGLFEILPRSEVSSYLSGDYFLMYPFCKLFSYNKWALAMPHLVVTIFGFFIFYLICKKYLKTIAGLIIAFALMALNDTLIQHAMEIRAYPVLTTLSLAVFYLTDNLIDGYKDMSMRKKVLLGTFFVFSIWFHPLMVVMVVSLWMFFLISRFGNVSGSLIKSAAKFMCLIFCIAMPLWIFNIFFPHLQMQVDIFEYIPNPLENITGFLKGVFGNLIGYKPFYVFLPGIIIPFIISYRQRWFQAALLFITVFLPLGVIFLGAVLTRHWFIQRQFVGIIPFFALFLAMAWESLFCYLKEKFLSS